MNTGKHSSEKTKLFDNLMYFDFCTFKNGLVVRNLYFLFIGT